MRRARLKPLAGSDMGRKSKAVAGLETWAQILWKHAEADAGVSFVGRHDAWRVVKFQLWGMARAFTECGEFAASEQANFLGDLAGMRGVMP
jgi:hypothetical protein